MAKIQRQAGTTSQIVEIFVSDTTSTTGAGKTGLTNTNFTCYYKRNKGTASVSVTLDASSGVTLGTFEPANNTNGAIKEVDSTNMPGLYEFHLANNGLASGADEVVYMLTGSGIRVSPIEIELTATNNQDGTRGGMTALPNANAAASGGLPTIGATIPNATAGATGGLFIAGTNAATTINGTAASGATPGTAALTLVGGAASTTGGGVAGQGLSVTGGAGAASTNGAAAGALFSGGGTNTVASTAHGIQSTGASTGSGIQATSGGGATGDGITATASSTNGNGIAAAGVGTGDGIKGTAGATGHGIEAVGGATSGSGMKISGVAGNAIGLEVLGQGSAAGISANGGATGNGVSFTGGASSGAGLNISKGMTVDTITASGAVAFQSTFAVTTSTSLGALSCTTLTASGAVAFQSTFAVTTSTSLAALSCTTLTASGAVAFQSTFTTTGNVAMNAGLTITQSTTNAAGLNISGNGSGAGISATGGNALTTTAAGPGAIFTGGAATTSAGGISAPGFKSVGGLGAASTNGASDGMSLIGGGTTTVSGGNGFTATGTGNQNGVSFVHSGTGLDLSATSTSLLLAKTTNITGLNDVSTSQVQTSCDAAITANTTIIEINADVDELITTLGTPLTLAQIATAVWTDTTSSDFTAANSIGKSLFTNGAVPGATGGLLIAGSNAATTFASFTCTGNLSVGGGITVTQSTANGAGISVTGNGTGSGASFTSGGGATGDGITATSAATNGNGMTLTHAGSGKDLNATTTPLTLAKTTNITGFNDIPAGTQMDLINAPNATALAAISSANDSATLEGSITHIQGQRIILASCANKTNGSPGTSFNVRDVADSKNRIAATVDANGNRTAVTVDGT